MEKFEFYLVWESGCRNFIDVDITFSSPDLKGIFEIHVFFRPDNPRDAMPPQEDYIFQHQSLTTSPFASKTTLHSYLHQLYGSSIENSNKTIVLVGEYGREYEELVAILKIHNSSLHISEVDGEHTTFLEILENIGRACTFCKMIFRDEEETDDHHFINHDFFCNNTFCERSNKRFYLENELFEHKTSQERCFECSDRFFCSFEDKRTHMKDIHGETISAKPAPVRHSTVSPNDSSLGLQITLNELQCSFCPQKAFRNQQQREAHMKYSHKKCNCGCGDYFENRNSYIAHFYKIYPLPCFEVRKCPQRFQSLYYQVKHHEQKHQSDHPFYCVSCCRRQEDLGNPQKIYFKDIKGLRNHGRAYGHSEAEMYLEDYVNLESGLEYAKAPERTCSAINYY